MNYCQGLSNMLRTLFPQLLIAALLMAAASCRHEAAGSKPAIVQEPAPDTVRREPVPFTGAKAFALLEGTVTWEAQKSLGEGHRGTVQLQSGEFLVNQGQLLQGSAIIDMKTIAVEGMKDGGEKNTLENHLKDKDFFDVKNFPTAEVSFEEVLPSNLAEFNNVLPASLTIKGKTHTVNIPVRLTIIDRELTVESIPFTINRTNWGLNFRSGLLGTAKDKLIEDNIVLSVKARARG